jgi:sugar/nucleoside kinase (ribokinase family)
MDDLLIIGSTCVDVIIPVDRLPKTGEDLQSPGQAFCIGGCGWNVYRAARLSGVSPRFLSPVGMGAYGDLVAAEFSRWGLPVPHRSPQENGCCYCLVEPDGERSFLSVRGAEYRITWDMLDALPGSYAMAYVCGMELQEPDGVDILHWLEAHTETAVFYAPGPQGVLLDKQRQDHILALKPVLHLSEPEALILSGADTPEDAARILTERTGNTTVITLGGRGCLCRTADGDTLAVPTPPVPVVDTIGAGDTHAGMLLGCLHQGMGLEPALNLANRAAATVVARHGAEIPRRMEELI